MHSGERSASSLKSQVSSLKSQLSQSWQWGSIVATFTRFEDIQSWKLARSLTKEIYTITQNGRFSYDYGLRDQIRRASVSIISNVAEGFERDGDREFLQFLSIAKGSAGEVRAQLYIALDQNYIDEETFRRLKTQTEEISRSINGLMRYLRNSTLRGTKYKKPQP